MSRPPLFAALFALLYVQACTLETPTPPARAESPNGLRAPVQSSESPRAAGTESRVYRDPETGEFTVPPSEARGHPPLSAREAARTAPGPEMQETSIDGGGSKVKLRGRVLTHLSAKKDSSGKTTIYCEDTGGAQ